MSWAYIPGSLLRDPEFLAKLALHTKNEDLTTPHLNETESTVSNETYDDLKHAPMTSEQHRKDIDSAVAGALAARNATYDIAEDNHVREVTQLKVALTQSRGDVTEARQALDKFKTKVRDYLLESITDDDLDLQFAAEMLDNLGLEGMKRTYDVDVTLSLTTTVQVEATSEESAQDKVDEMGARQVFNDNQLALQDFYLNIEHVGLA